MSDEELAAIYMAAWEAEWLELKPIGNPRAAGLRAVARAVAERAAQEADRTGLPVTDINDAATRLEGHAADGGFYPGWAQDLRDVIAAARQVESQREWGRVAAGKKAALERTVNDLTARLAARGDVIRRVHDAARAVLDVPGRAERISTHYETCWMNHRDCFAALVAGILSDVQGSYPGNVVGRDYPGNVVDPLPLDPEPWSNGNGTRINFPRTNIPSHPGPSWRFAPRGELGYETRQEMYP